MHNFRIMGRALALASPPVSATDHGTGEKNTILVREEIKPVHAKNIELGRHTGI